MKQQSLENRDVFWLWWVLAPQLAEDEENHREAEPVKAKYQVVSLTRHERGGLEIHEDFADELNHDKQKKTYSVATEVRHYHVQRGHWYSSIPMLLLIILIIILIPIAVVIAFWVVISLFVNQSLFTMLAEI